MDRWLESVYSDGSECFVSNPQPALHEEVTVSVRMYEDAPVQHVYLRALVNGIEHLIKAEEGKVRDGLKYYNAKLKMTQNRISYHFYLVCDNIIYYYNQKEITTHSPNICNDFKLLADYRQPDWVKKSVFYQIFPERFYNGNPDNDVVSGEYEMMGHPAIKMPSWDSEVLPYEKGYCLDFFGGDLEGVEAKIPYLKELGVNAVYLNPIFLAPSVHKYDCIDYLTVDPHFGGDEALASLSAALHANDMKLILDISINHTGIGHKWFNKECTYYDKSVGAYNNPDSKERKYYFFKENSNDYMGWDNVDTLPTLNYTSEELREAIYKAKDSVLRKWLKPPYNIDGWRFDVADVFARQDEIQLSHELWPEIRKAIHEENDNAYILAEHWGDCGEYLQGDEWDSAMNYYGCCRILRQFLGQPDLFHMRDEVLRKVAYKMSAEDLRDRITDHLAQIPYVMWQNQFNLFDSHDVPRLHNDPKINPEEYRGAVILLFALIGTASIYYGDEAKVDGTIDSIEGCRYPMPWQKDFKESEQFRMYQTLAHLKVSSKAFSDGGMKFMYAKGNVVALARFYEDERYLAIISTDDKEQNIELALGSIGSNGPKDKTDVLGRDFWCNEGEDGHFNFKVEAHHAYLIRV